MTSRSRQFTRPITAVLAGLLALWLLWSTVQVLYAGPRATLTEKLKTATDRVDAYRRQLDDGPRVRDEMQAFVDRTLGGDVESVDHRLRTRLNRIVEAVAIGKPTVGTGNATKRGSPARTAFPRSGSWKRLRDEVDFVELEAWVAGEGGLDAVVHLVDRIDAEPWIKHIDHVKIDPKDNGDHFSVTVRLTTLFLPGRLPADVETPEYDNTRLARYSELVDANLFRVPPPVVAKAPPAKAPPKTAKKPPPKRTFPWHEWAVTGVAEGPDGPEVWLRRRTSGEARLLVVGGRFESAELVAAAGEWAEFQLDEERFRVRLGRTLKDRSPLKDERPE